MAHGVPPFRPGHTPAAASLSAAVGDRLAGETSHSEPDVPPQSLRPGCGAGFFAAFLAALIGGGVLTSVAVAQTASRSQPLALSPLRVQAAPRIGGNTDPCVVVDIAGRKAGQTDCAAQKLDDAAKAAQLRAKDGALPNIPAATSPDTRIGVASQTATKQRLGDNFGKSVLPQRPTPLPAAPTPFTRQH